MKKNNYIVLLIGIIILLCLGGFFYKTVTGNIVLKNYAGTAYAPPYNLLNNNVSIFNVTPDNLDVNNQSTALFNISVSMPKGYIYKKGYIYNTQVNRWSVFNFEQTPVGSSYWIQNNASVKLSVNSRILRNGENYIIAYACEKVNNTWECGCNNLSSRKCTNWMLQVVNLTNVSNIGVEVSVQCTSDLNCSSLDKCVGGICVSNVTIEEIIPLGTPENPFLISTCEQLQNISNNLTASYKLVNNIDCINTSVSGASVWGVEGFMPLGDWMVYKHCSMLRGKPICPSGINKIFSGNFNGSNYAIRNLYINRLSSESSGLFGYLSGNLSNIGLVNINVTGNQSAGGLVGDNRGVVSNSYVIGNITGVNNTGGLVGYNSGVVSNSYASGAGTSSSKQYTGTSTGGLVGYNSGVINNSYSTRNVSGSTYVGGLAGYQSAGTISNSYSTGTVSGVTNIGGLIGYFSSGIVSTSYWDNQTSGRSTSAGGIGKNTTQMSNISTFIDSGWSMFSGSNSEGVWDLRHGSYPLLKWASSFPCGRYVSPICQDGYQLIAIPPVDSCGKPFSLICVAS